VTFTFSVRDVGGLYDLTPNTLTISITQYSGVSIVSGVLRFGGGSGVDNVSVSGGNLLVNGVTYSLLGITEVRIWAGCGNDTIDLSGLTVQSFIDGGDGDDVLIGGSANDVILGGDGNDSLTGGAGNDFLVGGAGADRSVGSGGNDVLVAGDIAADLSLAALREISNAWASSRSVSDDAVEGILDETTNDDQVDTLTGGGGADLFIINTGDRVTDFNFKKLSTNKDGDVVVKDGQIVS
jgi:Ca2+-binding RTX toxin-like protein